MTGSALASGSALVRWWRAAPPAADLRPASAAARVASRCRALGLAVLAGGALSAIAAGAWAGSEPLVTLGLLAALAAWAALAPQWAVLAMPALFVWSPRFTVGLWAGEGVDLRLDHAVALGLALALADRRRRAAFPRSAVVLGAWCAITALGIAGVAILGRLAAPGPALLYLAQLLVLAATFGAACAFTPRRPALALRAWALAIVSAAGYGLMEQAVAPEVTRSFEAGYFDGQSNHVAGLFAMGLCASVALLANRREVVLAGCLLPASLAGLMTTGSREGAVAAVAGLAVVAWWAMRRGRMVLLVLMAAGAALLVWRYGPSLMAPGGSLHDRLVAWRSAATTFERHPLLGLGLGARHRSWYDNIYILAAAETGLLGLGGLLAWLAWLGRDLAHGLGRAACRPWALAALAALACAAVQGMAAIAFLITAIAGPLYWLAGFALGRCGVEEGARTGGRLPGGHSAPHASR